MTRELGLVHLTGRKETPRLQCLSIDAYVARYAINLAATNIVFLIDAHFNNP